MNQREKVLRLLEQSDNGVTTSDFLNAHLPRFSARIKELRDAGLVIETERLSASSSRYTLRPHQVKAESLGAPERESRGGGSANPSAVASTSGTGSQGARSSGGGASSTSVAPPSLFEVEPVGPRSHYEMEEV